MRTTPWLAAAGSGVLLFLAFPPFDLGWIAWLALVPLLVALHGRRPRDAFLLGWIAGTLVYGLLGSWLIGTLARFTHLGLVGACAVHLLFASALGTSVGLFAGLVAWTQARGAMLWGFVPACWVVTETLRAQLLPWLPLGASQHDAAAIVQVVEPIGVTGLSALVVLANAAVARWVGDPGTWRRLVGVGTLLIALVMWGRARVVAIERAAAVGTLRVAIVQTADGQERKWHPRHRDAITDRLLALTRDAATRNPDVIVWPETATPFAFDDDTRGHTAIQGLVASAGVPLIFGTPAADRPRPDKLERRNRVYMLDRSGAVAFSYDKELLVPFGEYVPFGDWLWFVGPIIAGDVPITAGQSGGVVRIDSTSVGILTCYEILAPDLARRRRSDGARILLNLSNDTWFAGTAASDQLLSQARLQAIEQRMPLIRVANDGPSAVVSASGAVMWRADPGLALSHVATIELRSLQPLCVGGGDAVVWMAIALVSLAVSRGMGPRTT